MENKVFEKNIAQIEAYDNKLYNRLLRFENKKSNVLLAQNENGDYNLIFQNEVLHDSQNPKQEAENIVSKIKDKENPNTIRVVWGLGLGYLADEFANSIKNGKIIIYEPNLEIIDYVLKIATIDALFQKNVILCQDKDTFYQHVKNFSNDKTELTISFLSSYKKLFFNDIKKTLECAQMAQGEVIANQNTFNKKTLEAIQNTISNIKKIAKNPDITLLKDIYKGKAALILCAGPSLEKNIDCVIKNKDKFVLFALNPTLKLLQEKGIVPDFVVDIETIDNSKQFENVDLSQSCLIIEPFVNETILKYKTKKTFNYISQENFINPWLRRCFDINCELKTLGSVSSSAFGAAELMGFEKIVLIGQDLAYSNGKCYAKGAQFEELKCIFDENEQKYKIIADDFEKFVLKTKTPEMTLEFAQKWARGHLKNLNNNIFTVLSQENKPLPTQGGYAFFIEIFAKMAKEAKEKNPNLVLINSSVGGSQIDNFENMPLEKVALGLKDIEKLDVGKIECAYNQNKVEKEILKLKTSLKNITDTLKKLCHTNLAIIKELENKRVLTPNAQKYLKKHLEHIFELENYRKTYCLDIIMLIFVKPIAPLVIEGNEAIDGMVRKSKTMNKRIERLLKSFPNFENL